ncbi:MAG: sialate O-acetylesterase, partial [Gammaproteobacteria bacterium]|nr:sialate O-acetylesterase [Gammaproteobacteria bacterium]
MLIVALALLSSCGEDIGSTANPDTTDEPSPGSGEGNNEQPDEGQGNDQGNNEGNNEGEGEPSGGSTGEFTLSMPTTLALVEGSGGITVNLVVNRQSGHNRTIELALEGAQPADNSQLEYAFSPPTLSGTDSVSALTLAVRIGAAPILQQQRNLRLSANDGVTTRELVIDLAVEPVAAPDVYLLIGQSNMVGFSLGGEKQTGPGEPDEPLARIRQLNVTGNDSQNFGDEAAFTDPSRLVAFPRFVTAEDPLHESYNPSIDGKSGTFIGLGLSFAKRALGSTERDIILVPSAWSGTGFCNNGLEHIAWNADTPDPSSDWLGGTALHDR